MSSKPTHSGVVVITTKAIALRGRVPLYETPTTWVNPQSGVRYSKKNGRRSQFPRERLDLGSVRVE